LQFQAAIGSLSCASATPGASVDEAARRPTPAAAARPVAAPPPPPPAAAQARRESPARRRRGLGPWLAVTAVLAVLGGAGWFFRDEPPVSGWLEDAKHALGGH